MENLEREIAQFAKETDFSGVVSLRRDSADIYSAAFGYRDVKDKLPNEISTKFGIASGTKLFIALAIGRLIDCGMISLDTAVKEIDPEFRGFIDGEATVLQLLSHTSGIYDYYDEENDTDFENFNVEIPWQELNTPTDYLPLFTNRRMKSRAGDCFSYSNGGFVLLGIIIEKVTGESYGDYLKKRILEPLEMKDSGFFAFNDLPGNTASGYLRDRKTTNIYNLPIRGGGDGGMYTTVADLQRFWRKLIDGEVLSPGLTSEYLKTRHEFDDKNGYGCGVYKKLDNSLYSILGCDAGVGFYSGYYVKKGLTVTVMSNLTNGEHQVAMRVKDIIENAH